MTVAMAQDFRLNLLLDFIRELRPMWGGDYRVFLENGTQLTLSRNYRSGVRDTLLPALS